MPYQTLAAILILLMSFIALPAASEVLPSSLMRNQPAEKLPTGYFLTWVFTIELESTDQSKFDQCRKLLLQNGFLISASRTIGTEYSKPLLKIVGTKEYATPSETTDTILEEVKKLNYGTSKFSWKIAEKISQKIH